MKGRLLTGLAALSLLGTVAAAAPTAAMAYGPGYHAWWDAQAIRREMRVVRGEEQRIALDRAALRRDFYAGNHAAAERDRQILRHDLLTGRSGHVVARMERHHAHHDWNR